MRCNGVVECYDSSDEIDCKVVHILSESYRNENPPSFLPEHKTQINMSGNIIYVGSFDRYAMTFRAGFDIKMSWFDNRLTFINLKSGDSGVKVGAQEKENIWIPNIGFLNSLDGRQQSNELLRQISP